MQKKEFFSGMKDGFPIFLGYLAVSFTFGIAASARGLSAFQATLMSAVNFTSAGQFAALDVIRDHLGYLVMALSQFIINMRYMLMSSALSQKFDSATPSFHRYLIAFGNTDEVFGISIAHKGKLPPAYCYGAIAAALPGWIGGTLLGSLSGNILPPSILSALGIALYGMFCAIVIPPARKNRVIALIVLISMGSSLLFSILPVLKEISSGFRIIILTVLIAGAFAFFFPIPDEKEEEK